MFSSHSRHDTNNTLHPTKLQAMFVVPSMLYCAKENEAGRCQDRVIAEVKWCDRDSEGATLPTRTRVGNLDLYTHDPATSSANS